MISINKSEIVPSVLNDAKAKSEFKVNISNKKYVGKDIYKEVKPDLEKLYYNKCAYCETTISAGGYMHIEHYRPKSTYYWLAYSWDNLLLSCPKCNQNKGKKFEIKYTKVNYKGQKLKDLHDKVSIFDRIEEPSLINPEQITKTQLNKMFSFKIEGLIIPKNENNKMEYTIKICDLNRDDLKAARLKILNNLQFEFTLAKDKVEKLSEIKKRLQYSIDSNEEYIAWKEFLLSNLAI